MGSQVHQSAIEPVLTAAYGLLNVASFTTLSPIVNDVVEGTQPPYTVIENPTESREDLMQSAGKNVGFQVHVVTDTKGDQAGLRIISEAIKLLHYKRPSMTNHYVQSFTYENTESFKEDINGRTIRHHVGIFRATVVQST